MSLIGKPIFVLGHKKAFLGKKVRIFPGLRLEVHGELGKIEIEDNVSIGQNFHIISQGPLYIGKGTVISGNVLVTDTNHEYRDPTRSILDQGLLKQKTSIQPKCFIGYGACIQAGTQLGEHCIVGANSVVQGTFPSHSVIVGVPGKIVKRYDFETQSWRKVDSNGQFVK